MKIYVDEQKRYEDTKATGQCFTAVGAIGLIAIVLLDTGVIKLAALDSVNKLMVSIVMGLVFLIFFIIGMKSFMELKDISKKIDRNNSLEEEIMERRGSSICNDSLRSIRTRKRRVRFLDLLLNV